MSWWVRRPIATELLFEPSASISASGGLSCRCLSPCGTRSPSSPSACPIRRWREPRSSSWSSTTSPRQIVQVFQRSASIRAPLLNSLKGNDLLSCRRFFAQARRGRRAQSKWQQLPARLGAPRSVTLRPASSCSLEARPSVAITRSARPQSSPHRRWHEAPSRPFKKACGLGLNHHQMTVGIPTAAIVPLWHAAYGAGPMRIFENHQRWITRCQFHSCDVRASRVLCLRCCGAVRGRDSSHVRERQHLGKERAPSITGSLAKGIRTAVPRAMALARASAAARHLQAGFYLMAYGANGSKHRAWRASEPLNKRKRGACVTRVFLNRGTMRFAHDCYWAPSVRAGGGPQFPVLKVDRPS